MHICACPRKLKEFSTLECELTLPNTSECELCSPKRNRKVFLKTLEHFVIKLLAIVTFYLAFVGGHQYIY